jgi:hypothetical protein
MFQLNEGGQKRRRREIGAEVWSNRDCIRRRPPCDRGPLMGARPDDNIRLSVVRERSGSVLRHAGESEADDIKFEYYRCQKLPSIRSITGDGHRGVDGT